MNSDMNCSDSETILSALQKLFFEVSDLTSLCPGLYYLSAKQPDDSFSSEYYVAARDTPILSAKAKAYGKPLSGCLELLLYSLHHPESGQTVVRYELLRYYVQNGLPLPEGYTLHSVALHGMEHHPEYFGTYPVPPLTPFGRTLRHRSLSNGICWLETDRAMQALSVAHPLWEDLSDTAQGRRNYYHTTGSTGSRTPWDTCSSANGRAPYPCLSFVKCTRNGGLSA